MHLVHRVLEALQPVARHELGLVLDQPFAERRRVGRKGRRRPLAEIGEDDAEMLARRIGPDLDLAGEPGLLGRLLDALPGAVEFPAMIDAADIVALDPAQMHLRAAMRAAIGDHLRLAGCAAIKREILAHHADRFGVPLRQILRPHDRHPEAPHKRAHRRAGAGTGKVETRAGFAFDGVHGESSRNHAGTLTGASSPACSLRRVPIRAKTQEDDAADGQHHLIDEEDRRIGVEQVEADRRSASVRSRPPMRRCRTSSHKSWRSCARRNSGW